MMKCLLQKKKNRIDPIHQYSNIESLLKQAEEAESLTGRLITSPTQLTCSLDKARFQGKRKSV